MMNQKRLSLVEIERLAGEGLPDVAQLGAAALVPFETRRLAHAKVVWMNRRWLAQRGLNLADAEISAHVQSWMLESFGWFAPLADDPESAFCDETRTFYADRYGADGAVKHGGSGRAGLWGGFQVKGIGVTPLVGHVTEWGHSHGCIWLEEAIREAICGEVIDAEFPHGGAPILAIIDTGLTYRHPDWKIAQRRALLVRPSVVRPAHLERAVGYLAEPGFRHEQLADVQRTKDAVQRYVNLAANKGAFGANAARFEELVERIAEQMAFGQVHRLFHGGYLSSNLSIDGALHDFGAFRAVPDWGKSYALDHLPPFGEEMSFLKSIVHSLAFYINKYQPSDLPKVHRDALLKRGEAHLQRAFDREVLRLWGVQGTSDAASALIESTRGYFAAQQRRRRSYVSGRGDAPVWVHDRLTQAPSDANPMDAESRLIAGADFALRGTNGSEPEVRRYRSWATAARLLMPRVGIYREELQGQIFDAIGLDADVPVAPEVVDRLVDDTLTQTRRHWPLLPPRLVVRAQGVSGETSVLDCFDPSTGEDYWWIEGACHGSGVVLAGVSFAAEELADFECHSGRRVFGALVPATRAEDGTLPLQLTLAGRRLKLFAPECRYVTPWFVQTPESVH